LAPALAGLVIAFVLGNSQSIVFAYPPIMLTAVLLVWRWLKPIRLFPAFLYASAVVFCMDLLFLFVLMGSFAELGLLILFNLSYAVLMVIPICIIRAFVQRRVTWIRFLVGYVFSTALSSIPIFIFFAIIGTPLIFILYPLGFISLSTIPMIVLIRWNAWVRDVVTGAMFLTPNPPE